MNDDHLAILKAQIIEGNKAIMQFLDMMKLSEDFLHDLLGAVPPIIPRPRPKPPVFRPKNINWLVEGF